MYVYDAIRQLTAEYGGAAPDTETHYLTTDALGSARLETSKTAQTGPSVVRNYDYLPFGQEIGTGTAGRDATFSAGYYPSAATGQSLRFTGKPRDAETGLDFFGARYFSGVQGRFMSSDAPFNDQDAEDPQSWNLYAYGRNNPLTHIDLQGQRDFDINNLLWTGWQVTSGFARGAASSLTGGLIGAPKSTDTLESRVGQAMGTTAVGVEGTNLTASGTVEGGIALAAAPETVGLTLAAVPGAVAQTAIGGLMVSGAVNNTQALLNTPMQASTVSGGPYKRPNNATTPDQRASVQGKACSTCGANGQKNVADHTNPLVEEYYRNGTIDQQRMRSPGAVRPQCQNCSNQQGGFLSGFSKAMKKLFFGEDN